MVPSNQVGENIDLLVVLEERSKHHPSPRDSSSGVHECLYWPYLEPHRCHDYNDRDVIHTEPTEKDNLPKSLALGTICVMTTGSMVSLVLGTTAGRKRTQAQLLCETPPYSNL